MQSQGRGAEGNQALGGAEGDAALCAFSHKRLYTFSQAHDDFCDLAQLFGQSNIIETNVALEMHALCTDFGQIVKFPSFFK